MNSVSSKNGDIKTILTGVGPANSTSLACTGRVFGLGLYQSNPFNAVMILAIAILFYYPFA